MRARRVGLVCAGGVTHSFLARLPALLASLGPLKATSYRVARRISNSLHAGRAVESYSALASCDAIWVAVRESALDRIVAALPPGIPLIVCDTPRDSSGIPAARAATIHAIPSDEHTLVTEGDGSMTRYLRRVAASDRRKLIEIAPASKNLFLAGVNLATHLALPWIAAAVESLRAAGFSRSQATHLVEELGGRTLRSYGKAGAKAWNPSAGIGLRRALDANLPEPRLADLYRTGIERALRFFGE
jgi:hypothetical protein